jgi:2-(1,2-epoxy-1,2-dihydrophenyl)acetyl-CoA isomerase
MAYNTLLLDISEGVATLKFNRPAVLNGLTTELLAEFDAVLTDILAPGSGVRCLLLTGEGRAFSSGADLASGDATGSGSPGPIDAGARLESHFNPLLERLMAMPIPLVTAINGPAAGAGCSFALAGDIVVAGKSAYFLQAFINIGLVPDVGSSWVLPRLVGKARAQAMMMLGEKIPADMAHDWGMIYKVVDDADLIPTALALAQKLARSATVSIGMIRTMVRAGLENTLTQQLHLERQNQLTAGRTQDFAEGVTAFLQKRPAKFTGK